VPLGLERRDRLVPEWDVPPLPALRIGHETTRDRTSYAKQIFFGSELSVPDSHGKNNIPFMLAGGDGKTVKTGRWIKCGNLPHNKLLTAILNVYGDTRDKFGDTRIDSAALKTPGLT
jgi:hypothetical protein